MTFEKTLNNNEFYNL